MGILLQLLPLLPVILSAIESFLPGVKGSVKWGVAWRIIVLLAQTPLKIVSDIQSKDTEKLFSDITAILVDAANQTGVFQHSTATATVTATAIVNPAVNKGS